MDWEEEGVEEPLKGDPDPPDAPPAIAKGDTVVAPTGVLCGAAMPDVVAEEVRGGDCKSAFPALDTGTTPDADPGVGLE